MAAFSSNIDITSGGTYGMDVTNGESSLKVANDLNGKMANIQQYLQNGLPEVWTGDSLPDSLPNGKIVIYNGFLYCGNTGGSASGVIGFTFRTTFDSEFSGRTYIVSGENYSMTGIVPSSLYAEITVPNLGETYDIGVQMDDGTIKTITATSKQYYGYSDVVLTISATTSSLQNMTWETISTISRNGTAASYFDVGDYKPIELSGTAGILSISGTYKAFIIGINHNSSREGNNRIHFQIGKDISGTAVAFCDSRYNSTGSSTAFRMNTKMTNNGGWRNSYMRDDILHSGTAPTSPGTNTFMSVLPSDLRAVMKSCTKYTDNTGGGSDTASYVTSTTEYLPLLAEFEVFGKRDSANSAEQNYQQQYQYYKNGNSKMLHGAGAQSSDTNVIWWLRSPYYINDYSFCSVASGDYYDVHAYFSFGVAPCFFV